MARTKLDAILEKTDSGIQEAIDSVQVQIDEIDRRLEPYEKLKERRDKLFAALNALHGGNKLTGKGQSKVNREMVKALLDKDPGKTPSELAEHFDVQPSAIGSLLYRNKEMFVKTDGKYFNRDPEAEVAVDDEDEEDE